MVKKLCKVEFPNMPKVGLSCTNNLVASFQEQMEDDNRRVQQVAKEDYKNRQRMQDEIKQTAINTDMYN